jgi:hypothetical protein
MDCLTEWDSFKQAGARMHPTEHAQATAQAETVQRWMLLGLHMVGLPDYDARKAQAVTLAGLAVQDGSAKSMTDALWMVAELYAEACQKVQMDWFAEQVIGLQVKGLENQGLIRLNTDTDKTEQPPPIGPCQGFAPISPSDHPSDQTERH